MRVIQHWIKLSRETGKPLSLEVFQDPAGQSPEQPRLNSVLSCLWAWGWTKTPGGPSLPESLCDSASSYWITEVRACGFIKSIQSRGMMLKLPLVVIMSLACLNWHNSIVLLLILFYSMWVKYVFFGHPREHNQQRLCSELSERHSWCLQQWRQWCPGDCGVSMTPGHPRGRESAALPAHSRLFSLLQGEPCSLWLIWKHQCFKNRDSSVSTWNSTVLVMA